eukprot:5363680-Lingulodinium_polyedra.AAC.1
MGTAWQFAAFQQTSALYLKDLSPQLWVEYVDYLLGDFVFGLEAKDGGLTVSSPPWPLILAYEHEIRKKAMKEVVKGIAMGAALRAAWSDPVTKERYFTTPLAFSATSGTKR